MVFKVQPDGRPEAGSTYGVVVVVGADGDESRESFCFLEEVAAVSCVVHTGVTVGAGQCAVKLCVRVLGVVAVVVVVVAVTFFGVWTVAFAFS